MKTQINERDNNTVEEKDTEERVELKAVCGLSCEECQFYGIQCAGCRIQRGRMFWGRCPVYCCCVYDRGLEFCADCSQFICKKFLDQITTSIGL
ncbi:MAG: DUF3795 domain-containing protein [bacterium]